jgi:hypothetical protein
MFAILFSGCSDNAISEMSRTNTNNGFTTILVETSCATNSIIDTSQTVQSVTGEIAITTDYGSFTVENIIDKLIENKEFSNDLYFQAVDITLTDMNNDRIPEIVMQMSAFPLSFIYSYNSNGLFHKVNLEDNPNYYIDGYNYQPYIKNGIKYYFAEYFQGGSSFGEGGINKIYYENSQLIIETIAEMSYNKTGMAQYEYTYSLGNLENLTEEEYDIAYQEYLSEYEKADDVIVSARFINHSNEEKLDILSDLLKEYFMQINDKSEQ